MLTDEQRDQSVCAQDMADALTLALLEVFAALAPNQTIGSEMLEDVAGRLLDSGQQIGPEPLRTVILALAQNLIETETSILGE